MTRHETDIRLARCGWLACAGQEYKTAVSFVRRALVFASLTGEDTRQIVHDARIMLLSAGRLRITEQFVRVLYEGDDFGMLREFTDEAYAELKVDLFAKLISNNIESVAAICEQRALAVTQYADQLIEQADLPKKVLVLKATFLHEIKLLLSDEKRLTVATLSDRVDHFFSQLSRLDYTGRSPLPPPRPQASEIRWGKKARGLRHGVLRGVYRFGPLQANLIEASPKYWQIITVDASKLPPAEVGLPSIAKSHGAQFGTNGGFFLVSEADPSRYGEPVGLLVNDGIVQVPPTYRRTALLMDRNGYVDIWRVGLIGSRIKIGKAQVVVRKVNNNQIFPGEIVVYSSSFRKNIPAAKLYISLVGRKVTDVSGEPVDAVPVNGLLLAIEPGPADLGPLANVEPGEQVTYELPPMRGLDAIESAMAGGPALLLNGQRDCDLEADDFDGQAPPAPFGPRSRIVQSLLPRTAWGITDDFRMIAVTVDGRHAGHSAGIDLDNLARLMRDLGCVQAVNMDNGGSAQMVIGGKPVDRADDHLIISGDPPPRKRPVASAILLVEQR